MPLVILGGVVEDQVEDAVRAFEAAGYTRAAGVADADPAPNRVLGLPGGGVEALRQADQRGVRYTLVHLGPPDGLPGGSHERAHHRVEAAELPALARRVMTRERMLVTCLAFGFKQGIPPESAWVFDVRFLDNPYWEPELRPLTGLDAPVREYVLGQPAAGPALDGIVALLAGLLPDYERHGRSELTVALGCTGGQHRSVAMAAELARRLADLGGIDVELRARELPG
jgi:hypothetical protein